ncbi:DUF5685 family protein [Bacillus thuringiensis]|uniref:DUF5685 family protein n=1 Tax=Bacillus thuringiensis TaxID=1428 RepID=UPI003F6AE0AA
MLGYFKPVMKLLSDEEKKFYQSLYCTLCHNLKNDYGHSSTMFIQHDLLFFLLSSGLLDEVVSDQETHLGCVAFPVKKVSVFEKLNNISFLADMSVFTVYTAYLNAVVDGKGLKVKNKGLHYVFNKAFEKSKIKLRFNDEKIEELKSLLKAEHTNDILPDQIIKPICEVYSSLIIENLELGQEYKELAFHMCRTMYYLDALEDFKKDKKEGYYNMLSSIYESPQQLVCYVQMRVFDSINKMKKCVKNCKYSNIIDSVLSYSLIGQFNNIKFNYLGDEVSGTNEGLL